tara:strand:+ start:133 stop:291 length:159 start_codon:yes stop_codon:yes gene_type:complete
VNKLPEDIRKSIDLLIKVISMSELDINIQTGIKQELDNLRTKIIYFEEELTK